MTELEIYKNRTTASKYLEKAKRVLDSMENKLEAGEQSQLQDVQYYLDKAVSLVNILRKQ